MFKDLNIIEARQEILKIIVFYDIFDFPLTIFEIKKQLKNSCSFNDLEGILSEEINKQKLYTSQGFYFLKKREDIIAIRLKRYNYSLRKIKIAKKFAYIFSKLSFILKIYLCRSSSVYNFKEESDIDFFIVTKNKRIWLVRFFLATFIKILNKRPNKKTKKDKICLSFFVSEDKTDLSIFKLDSGDPDFDFWESNLLLLYNDKKLDRKIVEVDNLNKNYNNKFLDFLEKLSFKLQLKIMPNYLKLANDNNLINKGVIFNDDVIKLHLHDPRLKVKKIYEERIKGIF